MKEVAAPRTPKISPDAKKAWGWIAILAIGSLLTGLLSASVSQELAAFEIRSAAKMVSSVEEPDLKRSLGPQDIAFLDDPVFSGEAWGAYAAVSASAYEAETSDMVRTVNDTVSSAWLPWVQPRLRRDAETYLGMINKQDHYLEFMIALAHARQACETGPGEYLASWTWETPPRLPSIAGGPVTDAESDQAVMALYPLLIETGIKHLCPVP